ncbi:MAG: hypothetical protein R3C19_03275 [Planctomycetaceae bacterium]
MVSYGLLSEIRINGAGSGDLAGVGGDTVNVDVKVSGPHWVTADRVELYANGRLIREQEIPVRTGDDTSATTPPTGIKWEGRWTIPRPAHDVHLVATAFGPGIDKPYWKTAKAYQPTSPVWRAHVIGCSGALWLDCDGDGKKTAAREYARRLWEASEGDLSKLLSSLSGYDSAVAAHAADFFRKASGSLTDAATREAVRDAPPAARDGFREYQAAWRATETARSSSGE